MTTRTAPKRQADLETRMRRATIAIQLADSRLDAARVVKLRAEQDELLDEWAALPRQ